MARLRSSILNRCCRWNIVSHLSGIFYISTYRKFQYNMDKIDDRRAQQRLLDAMLGLIVC